MEVYFLLGKYSAEGAKGISADRTKRGSELIERLGGKVDTIYAVLGEYDLIMSARFPDNKTAMKASMELSKLSGVSFVTMPAIPIDDFDKMASG